MNPTGTENVQRRSGRSKDGPAETSNPLPVPPRTNGKDGSGAAKTDARARARDSSKAQNRENAPTLQQATYADGTISAATTERPPESQTHELPPDWRDSEQHACKHCGGLLVHRKSDGAVILTCRDCDREYHMVTDQQEPELTAHGRPRKNPKLRADRPGSTNGWVARAAAKKAARAEYEKTFPKGWWARTKPLFSPEEAKARLDAATSAADPRDLQACMAAAGWDGLSDTGKLSVLEGVQRLPAGVGMRLRREVAAEGVWEMRWRAACRKWWASRNPDAVQDPPDRPRHWLGRSHTIERMTRAMTGVWGE